MIAAQLRERIRKIWCGHWDDQGAEDCALVPDIGDSAGVCLQREDPALCQGVRIGSKLVLALTLWLLIVADSFGWNLHQAAQNREDLALETGRSFFQLLLLTRRWNASHGGVYVPVTDRTQPNPYLEDPRRDIQIGPNLTLTKVNPAFMTRQLAELAAAGSGVQFHITSLGPVRPENAALPWEADALRAFERGLGELGRAFEAAGQRGYRYMAPLRLEEPCLRCHADQGYELGDVRGGISITLPTLPPLPITALSVTHLIIALTGAAVILVMGGLLAKAYSGLHRLATLDPLTCIPNRRLFVERLALEWRRAQRSGAPLSLLLCDIDHFKGYNDHFGHQQGDRCLQQIARLVQESLHRAGDFCARYGGEELVVVLPSTDLEGAARLAERIRAELVALDLRHPDAPLGIVTLSIGVAAIDASDSDPEVLIGRADLALYRAKQRGRNRVAVQERQPATSDPTVGVMRAGVLEPSAPPPGF